MPDDDVAAAREAIHALLRTRGTMEPDEIARLYLHGYYLGGAHAIGLTIGTSENARDVIRTECLRRADAALDDD